MDEFAEYHIALGEPLERIGDIYWLRTKGLFLRPLLFHQSYSPSALDLPSLGLGGFQYVVSDSSKANSTLRFLSIDEVHAYALENLHHKRRLLIKNAAKHFVIRQIKKTVELQEQGFHPYSSFYRRTGYQYKPERTRKSKFAQWTDLVHRSKTIVLGGYDKGSELKAVSISFHAVRDTACRTAGIEEIIVRRYQGGNGMDSYYLLQAVDIYMRIY